MKEFEVRVKYKGRSYGSDVRVGADSMTIEDGIYRFWLHNVSATGEENQEMTASFPINAVESVTESGHPVSDAAVIHRFVDVIIVYIVEQAKAGGEPLSEEQKEQERQEWTKKFKKVFAAARAGNNAVREFLATASQALNLLG